MLMVLAVELEKCAGGVGRVGGGVDVGDTGDVDEEAAGWGGTAWAGDVLAARGGVPEPDLGGDDDSLLVDAAPGGERLRDSDVLRIDLVGGATGLHL